MKATVLASKNWRFMPLMASMPELYHKIPDEEYSDDDSEVLAWIIEKANLQDDEYEWSKAIFGTASSHGFIRFDPEAGTWIGEVMPWNINEERWPHPADREWK